MEVFYFRHKNVDIVEDNERIFADDTSDYDNDMYISKRTLDSIVKTFKFIKYDELVDIVLIIKYVNIGDNCFLFSLRDYDINNAIILSNHQIPTENVIFSSLYTYAILIKN